MEKRVGLTIGSDPFKIIRIWASWFDGLPNATHRVKLRTCTLRTIFLCKSCLKNFHD